MSRDDWPRVPLGAVLTKSDEWIDIDPSKQYSQVTVRLWGKGVVERAKISGSEIAAARQIVVRAQQFILSRIDARHGAFGLIPGSLAGAVVSTDFPTFSLNPDRIFPAYLAWLSRTQGFVDLCKAASEGTTNRVRLKEDRFLGMTIALPPLAEQQRIVGRIEALAARITEARALQEAVTEGMYRLLLTTYADITKGAAILPMKKVAPLQRRPVRIDFATNYPELGIRSFGKGTFHKPAISGADVGTKKLFQIEQGDLLFNIVFAWEGAVAVAKPEDAGRFGSHRFLTCVPHEGLATSPFLRFHFLTQQGLHQLGQASPGGAGRNRTLGLNGLEKVQVPVPAYKKQLWFDALQALFDAVRAAQATIAAELDALVSAVLDRAFQGAL